MANRIQLRRGGAQEWANANPTLAQGELGIELDTGRIKIGDGVTAWNSLRYERPIESTSNTANTLVQRDADGNFSAGTVTATLIGNASTASRLASVRQISLAEDLTGSGVFDGSQNLAINATLQLLSNLPHYDGTDTATGQYTRVLVDAKGRVINASNPTTIQDYGLDTSVEGTGAQPFDNDLNSVAGLNSTGFITRSSPGNMQTRTITGTATRIAIADGGGINGNPIIDLIVTAVQAGDYNTESLTSVSAVGSNNEPFGTQTVNATKFTVDAYGRLTSATNVPIATATEGSKYPNYDAGTAYSRYAIIQNASKVYQAIADISAGAGAPTHSSGDTGSWRYLAAEATEQKGLASFAQEDFDVDSNGHVTIAAVGVDNTQLQNNRVSFADGNTKEDFELDQELTATTGYRGFNYLNYVKVNDTSGNLLFGANNTGDSGAGEIDVNVRSYFSDPDITLDGAVAQTLDKTGDGNLTFQLTQNTANNRNFSILSTNAGSGTSTVTITAEDVVDIDASDANGKVHVENARFQANYIATTDATLHLDPGDDRAVTGLVRVWGDLQVDGTTTTVNSTVMTVDDPIITLGGDTAPSADDNLDRGVEFRYYDSEARLGFYGWDTNYTDLGGHEGGYRFLHAATNTSEVFSGTDSGLIAGNLKLTTGTASSSNTTGDLVVAGGAGIGGAVNIGGLLDVDSTLRVHSTSRFDDNMVIQGASKTLQLNNGSGTTKIELQSTTGNGSLAGILDVTGNFNVNSNKFNVVASSGNTSIAGTLDVANNSEFNGTVDVDADFAVRSGTTDKFTVASATGNTIIAGTLGVTGDTTITGALDANSTLNVAGFTYLESTAEPDIALNSGTGEYEIQNSDYGAFRFDGGGYIEGDFMFNSDVYVNGQVVQKESVSEVFNKQNYLQVRYKLRTGTSNALNPNYASHGQSNLRVYGGAGIYQDLHIGDDLYIGKLNSGDTVEFSVLGESGNTEIGRSGAGSASAGTLTVHGDVTFNRELNITGAQTTIGDSTSDSLTVAANSEFNGTVDIDANFAVRSGTTDKFTVASASGNVATDGTLVVQGETTINDSLIVDAANEVFSIRNGSAVEKFGVDADNGNTNIVGTLTVGSTTQINNTLGATGVVSLTNNADQTLTGNYGADGGVRITGGVGIQRNLAVGQSARIYGDLEVTGATTQTGNLGIAGRVDITNTSDATSFGDGSVALVTDGGFRASKNAWVGGDLHVWDDGNSRNAFYVDVSTGDATLHNDLTVGGDLVVNGTTTTVNSTVTTIDDPLITLGGDTAPSSNDGKDRGVEFRYYDGSAKMGFLGFDRSANQFAFLINSTNSSEVHSGTDGALRAGSLNLTGSGTALDVDANANIDGTLTVDGQIISQVSSGPALVIPNTTKINNLNSDLLDGMTTASANTASTVVNRDASGNFSAGTITAALTGNASTATTLETARTITIDGVVDGSVSFNGSADVTISTTYNDADITALAAMSGTGLVARTADNTYAQRSISATASSGVSITNGDGVSGNITINVASSANNAANNLVLRDASGDFAAGTITATLTGNVTGNLTGDVTGTVSDISNHDTADLAEGTNLYYTNARADARADLKVAAATGANLSLANKTTNELAEGQTNLYYTETRVQDKLDNAFEQLRAMLNNLATTTTLVLNLSGDPTPGDVATFNNATLIGGTGYVTATNISTSSTGNGVGLTVDITAVAGEVTSITINQPGSGYLENEIVTVLSGNQDASIRVATIKTMVVGQTLTGTDSGTTAVITALGATSATVDTVDGFFKKTETVSAGNVSNLTISSFG